MRGALPKPSFLLRLVAASAAALLLAPTTPPMPAGPPPSARPAVSPSLAANYQPVWDAQPRLLARAIAGLPPRRGRAPRVFTLAIAAGGSQAIFGREAEAVGNLLGRRLGRSASGVLLSNAEAHHERIPLANRDNLSAVLAAIGERFDPATDLAVIFLTAHGGPNGALQTDLPNAFGLRAIDARYLAETLGRSSIGRRIVIVSACFSGTWIEPLASPDTIVLTASSASRTSFGCDDRREFTHFGAALLGGGLREGMTWRAAFERLQSETLALETQLNLPPSQPSFSVGANMEAVWNAPLGLPGRR